MSSDKKIKIVIDNKLYDLTNFGKVHPGGKEILENFHDCDATDYFYLLHSNKAREMLKQLKYEEIDEKDKIPQSDILKLAFKLEKEGYFEANMLIETLQGLFVVLCMIICVLLCKTYPMCAAIALAIGLTVGGWIGHTYDHQRNNALRSVSQVGAPLLLGISLTWWSQKHNRHHVSTNEIDHDGDIQLYPFLYLWKPSKEIDSWNRRFQHVYFTLLYSILQLKWQVDSILYAWKTKNTEELALLAVHWVFWITCIPWKVWLTGALIGGTMLAWIVTANHQAEFKWESKRQFVNETPIQSKYKIHDLAAHQIISTRNIYCPTWFENLLCGGLQYQIEHHLFPRMPIYNLPLVRPIVMEYCKTHGLEYLEENFWDISKRNYNNIEYHAHVKVN